MIRLLLVVVLVAPLSEFVTWAVTPAYAVWILIPYGCLCGYAVHHLRAPRMPRFPQLLLPKGPAIA